MISRIKKTHQKPLAAISYETTNTGKKKPQWMVTKSAINRRKMENQLQENK
jgi:hypothetical protein